MDCETILKHLYGLESPKVKLGLGNIRSLLQSIGNPEKSLRCIHVAGTNGKGSVCSMVSSILVEGGYKVGLYTSPHLKKFNERIRVNARAISDEDIASYFLRIMPFIMNQSFFEITTALAFLYFREKGVDFVVVEVGLGGRLDATNVIRPLVSVITNISLEHTELLGNKMDKIAFEKAGIIKPGVPAVTGSRGKSLETIREICKKRKSPLFGAGRHSPIIFDHLKGAYQQDNGNVALTTIKVLRKSYPDMFRLDDGTIRNGIRKTRWKGRMEFHGRNFLIDCAHNPAGFRALRKELSSLRKKYRKFIFVIGIQSTKDGETMLATIKPLASAIIFTKSGNPKAAEPKKLADLFNSIPGRKKAGISIFAMGGSRGALSYAKKACGKNDLIVLTGSIYLIGELI